MWKKYAIFVMISLIFPKKLHCKDHCVVEACGAAFQTKLKGVCDINFSLYLNKEMSQSNNFFHTSLLHYALLAEAITSKINSNLQ